MVFKPTFNEETIPTLTRDLSSATISVVITTAYKIPLRYL